MCFLSIPAIIYLVMVPMWSRAKKFASAYAFLAVDLLYTILWFAAFIAVAMWNSQGIKDGAKEKKIAEDDRNCTTFAYGSESKCNVSKAAVGVGVMVFIFFLITSAISGYYLHKFLREGILPYESSDPNPHYASGDNGKDNAWSTEIEQQNDSDDDDRHTERGGNQEEDEYALLHSTETDQGRHPGRPLSWGEDRNGDPYERPPTQGYADYRDASDALSPGGYTLGAGGYEEFRREAAGSVGPAGDRAPSRASHLSHGGSGYSFGGANHV
ncbi:hypothetical protein N0V94_009158 [Neodidymelliopsis sp. IMI 364377]|nr:hypothetical protein N0V94_009158 [Neodidymelliopsis sp. IMI 364377]